MEYSTPMLPEGEFSVLNPLPLLSEPYVAIVRHQPSGKLYLWRRQPKEVKQPLVLVKSFVKSQAQTLSLTARPIKL